MEFYPKEEIEEIIPVEETEEIVIKVEEKEDEFEDVEFENGKRIKWMEGSGTRNDTSIALCRDGNDSVKIPNAGTRRHHIEKNEFEEQHICILEKRKRKVFTPVIEVDSPLAKKNTSAMKEIVCHRCNETYVVFEGKEKNDAFHLENYSTHECWLDKCAVCGQDLEGNLLKIG